MNQPNGAHLRCFMCDNFNDARDDYASCKCGHPLFPLDPCPDWKEWREFDQ